jgi:F-box/leucine-rich repeat protein 14
MGAAVGAESIEQIEALPRSVTSVRVAGLDDAKALALSRRRELQCIVGDGNPVISDEGLGLLAELPLLKVLDLEWCSTITDAGLEKLKNLGQLRWLDLSFCRGLSDSAVEKLRSSLSECKIDVDGV